MKIKSFDPLFEYPDYDGMAPNAKANATAKSVTATGEKPSQAPSASPNTSGVPTKQPTAPTTTKAEKLKKDFEYLDDKGDTVKVVSPVNQGVNPDGVVVQNQKSKEYYTLMPDSDVTLPQVEESASLDNILDRKKTNFAKKISRKQNKIKQLIRAQKFGNTHKEPVFELDFNNKEIMQNALDAPIQCGFEAETTWPSVDSGVSGFSWDYTDWDSVESAAMDLGYQRELARMKDAYNDWVSEIALEYEGEVVQRMVDQRKEDEAYIDEFVSSELSESDIEEYKDEKLQDLRNIVDQGDMFDSETIERKQAELDEYEDWDDYAWGREYTEEFAQSALEEWIADQIRDEGEAWEEAAEDAQENNDMDDWCRAEHDSMWSSACAEYDIFINDEEHNDLDTVASGLYDWASTNSHTSEIQQGSYHSGKSIDNDYWRVEDDSSIEGEGAKAEIISPVYQTPREMLTEMKSLFSFFEDEGVETNSTTGLHVTMSFGGETKKINPLVLATLLGDKYVLTQFNRQYNSYAKSQQENIQQEIERMLAQGGTPEDFNELYGILNRGIDGGKFTSINFKQGAKNSDDNQLVEFRIAGGDDYHNDYDKAAKAVIRYAATMNASSEEDPANRKDFLKTVYRMINKGGDSLTPTRKDSNVSLPENDFVQAVRYILNQTGQRLDAVETLDRAYKELAGGDGVLAKEHFTEFMKTLLVSTRSSERTGSFKLKPTSMLVRGFKQAMKQFGVSREDIIRAVSQHYINNSDYLTTSTGSDIHDDFIVPTVAILDKILLRKNQPQPERGPSLALPRAQNGVTYIRRSAYAGQSQYDKDAPVNIANDIKTIPMHDHVEIDKLIIARNILTDHPHELDPNLAADAKQKVAKIDANLAEYEKTYGIKFASRYSKAGQEMDAFQLAGSTDPVWQRHLRSKGIHLYKAESKTFDRFDAMSLAEQLALLSKVDKRKIDEAWAKKLEAEEPTADKSARAKLDLNLRDRGHKVEKPKKGKGSYKRKTKHQDKLPEADQVKTKERKPKTIKPNTGHQSKHPYQGRLVGESQHLEEGMDGILKAFAIAGVILFVGADVVKGVEQKRQWNAAYEEIKTQDPAKADEIKRLMRKYKMSVSNKDLIAFSMQYKNDINKIIYDFEKQNGLNEGAVPDTSLPDEYRQIMSKPLLGSDLKGQMHAFQIVPAPAMIKEFRKQISMSGKDCDLRQVFKSFADARLHPINKKKVGLSESRGVAARNSGDTYISDTDPNDILTIQRIDVLPPDSANYETTDELEAAIAQLVSGDEYIMDNSPPPNPTAAIMATVTDQEGNAQHWVRYIRAVPAGGVLTLWKTLNGYKYSRGVSQETLPIKPSDLITTNSWLSTKRLSDEISDNVRSAFTDTSESYLIDFMDQAVHNARTNITQPIAGAGQHTNVIIKYAGEYLGPLALVDGGNMEGDTPKMLESYGLKTLKGSKILFPDDTAYELIDSLLKTPDGKRIGISSKAHIGGGAASSISGIFKQMTPDMVERYPDAAEVLTMLANQSAIVGPLSVAVKLKVISQAEAKSIIDLGRRTQDPNDLSTARLRKLYDNQGVYDLSNPGYRVLWHILTAIVNVIVPKVNSSPEFGNLVKEVLNNNNVLQLMTDGTKQGDNLTLKYYTKFPTVYQGSPVLYNSSYYTTGQKGRLGFKLKK